MKSNTDDCICCAWELSYSGYLGLRRVLALYSLLQGELAKIIGLVIAASILYMVIA